MNSPVIGSRVRANVPGWPDLHGRVGVIVGVDKDHLYPVEVQCDGHDGTTRFLEDEVESDANTGGAS
jgi:hypothetical protein